MEPTSLKAISEGSLDPQNWNITFIGGTADIDDPPQGMIISHTPGGELMPLSTASVGDRLRIVQVIGGRRMLRRLRNAKIVQGSEVTVVSRIESGSVIVAIQGCRIGLGAEMAHRVIVGNAA